MFSRLHVQEIKPAVQEATAGRNDEEISYTILCMLPDTGERYLSTPLFADISTDMTSEELEISHSTPGCWL